MHQRASRLFQNVWAIGAIKDMLNANAVQSNDEYAKLYRKRKKIENPLKHTLMNIDQMEFIAWMERIMARFDILGEHINDIEKQRNSIDGEELLDNQDLLQMLKISNRSLQRYRSNGKLPYYTISGKLYYKQSDVHQFIRESFNDPLHSAKDNK